MPAASQCPPDCIPVWIFPPALPPTQYLPGGCTDSRRDFSREILVLVPQCHHAALSDAHTTAWSAPDLQRSVFAGSRCCPTSTNISKEGKNLFCWGFFHAYAVTKRFPCPVCGAAWKNYCSPPISTGGEKSFPAARCDLLELTVLNTSYKGTLL